MGENKYQHIAEEIIKIVGKENILSATHCATRLRLVVKDHEKIDTKAIENVDEVKGTFFNSGQYQIILGTGIARTLSEIIEDISTAPSPLQNKIYPLVPSMITYSAFSSDFYRFCHSIIANTPN